ncbi:hypothetical protein SAMN05444141_101478 [Pseudovibrio denitrificans]|uniref:Uncharacterized protein n=1 Tax=Pseudovibrio denitrificans TaxID=258256 RepID=A0A1I6XWD4_9HYPH|nr:hypothetical protein SAMN05444141_101478 [Pseudovibrio denitrificans]
MRRSFYLARQNLIQEEGERVICAWNTKTSPQGPATICHYTLAVWTGGDFTKTSLRVFA